MSARAGEYCWLCQALLYQALLCLALLCLAQCLAHCLHASFLPRPLVCAGLQYVRALELGDSGYWEQYVSTTTLQLGRVC